MIYRTNSSIQEAAKASIQFKVTPMKSVNGVQFGASRDDVRKAFGKYTEFKKTSFSKSKTDNFGDVHVFYDANGGAEAFEIFGDDITIGSKHLPMEIEEAKKIISDLKEDANDKGHYISKKYAIGIYAPKGKIKSVLFGTKGYYNESASLVTEAADSSKAYNNQWKYKIPLKTTKVFDDLQKSEGVTIPDELREFVEKTNGATPDRYLFTVGKTERCYGATLSFNKGDKDHDTAFAASEIFDIGMVPMGIDPFGNYICYNPKNGAIMFWNHESDSVNKVADSLSSFLSSLHKVEKK